MEPDIEQVMSPWSLPPSVHPYDPTVSVSTMVKVSKAPVAISALLGVRSTPVKVGVWSLASVIAIESVIVEVESSSLVEVITTVQDWTVS